MLLDVYEQFSRVFYEVVNVVAITRRLSRCSSILKTECQYKWPGGFARNTRKVPDQRNPGHRKGEAKIEAKWNNAQQES